MKNWQEKPDLLFLFFAVPFGLLLVFLIPPLGGGDEGFHYHRIASIAFYQVFNKPVEVPSGIAAFIQSGSDFFRAGMQPPFSFSLEQWHKMAVIPLDSNAQVTLLPDYMTVHHPLSYIPQILVFRLGVIAGLTPLAILYAGRVAGLVCGIGLTFLAIRRVPSHKDLLCAFALFPTMMAYRSTMDADALVNGLAFLFIASLFYEITAQGIISFRNIIWLALLAFVLAQCKNVYLLLLLLAFAIPAERFSSFVARMGALMLVILPGTVLSLVWMVLMKQTYFTGIHYHTWGGDAYPDMQAAFIFHHPLGFLKIMVHTLFSTPLLPVAFLETIGDVGPGYSLPVLLSAGLCYLLIAVIAADRQFVVPYGNGVRVLSATIFIMAFVTILALLYIHWTGLEAPIIQGFQGRYFCPLLPLLIPFIQSREKPLLPITPASCVALFAFSGLTVTVWVITKNYY